MKKEIIEMVRELGNDADFRECKNNIIVVTIDDFLGFNDNYEEEFREYENPQKVEAFKDFLESECIKKEGILYTSYTFKDCEVVLGYTSFDI